MRREHFSELEAAQLEQQTVQEVIPQPLLSILVTALCYRFALSVARCCLSFLCMCVTVYVCVCVPLQRAGGGTVRKAKLAILKCSS
jgi:hypothetical protein